MVAKVKHEIGHSRIIIIRVETLDILPILISVVSVCGYLHNSKTRVIICLQQQVHHGNNQHQPGMGFAASGNAQSGSNGFGQRF